MADSADAVVIGAGIAGVAAAYHLAVAQGFGRIRIVDPRPPLSLTSDKSTECYRNWWPNLPMVQLMNHSIDLLEQMAVESDNVFGLNRRGYLFVTGDDARFHSMIEQAHVTSTLGAGPVRFHPGPIPYRASPEQGYLGSPEGGDILVGSDSVREHFPFITEAAVGAIHVRRAGWFSAQQLGAWMLEQAREKGAFVIQDAVIGIAVSGGSVNGVSLAAGGDMETQVVVDAAGPMSRSVAALVGVDLPLFAELHLKVAYREHLGVIPRHAPMFIWSDPQTIDWNDEERAELERQGRSDLLGKMPIFCHGRPEGGPDSSYLLGLWEYHGDVREPVWPLPEDPLYPEVVMRGLTTMAPRLAPYSDGLPQSVVDGGYYIKTRENRPLVGPAGPGGFHLMAGMSGFGVMAAAGAGDLLARHVAGVDLPGYSDAFLLSRYDDPAYLASIEGSGRSGQL
ncbi:MAG TPA: FAD-dependent oxidoreductase [Acidimicrobiia bacterium]|nr:FAD-dependent oxidoreductase [Acidimicrobiia bacterium]